MVVHDETKIQEWIQMKEERQVASKPRLHFSVVAVQGIACAVLLLLALLLRLAGGEVYGAVRKQYQHALARNELVTALARLWNDQPLENTKIAENNDVKADGFTDKGSALLVDSSVVTTVVMPLESGVMTSGYGKRIHPINGGEEFHSGVDIAAPVGTELLAMYDGIVVDTGENDTLGRYIRMRHSGGVEVLYGHCQSVVAQQDDVVQAGEIVALVGSTGVSTGNHVHLSVWMDGSVCDPASLIALESYA